MASCSASALITVASMPMVSDVVRSIPWPVPVVPRQMLPPPTTMASSRLRSSAWAVAISPARRSTTAASMVSSDADEANASPDIFSTSRRRCTFAPPPNAAGSLAAGVPVGSQPTTTWAKRTISALPIRSAMERLSSLA